MKKLTSIFLCAVMIMTMMSMTISANAYAIGDGGQPGNTGTGYVTGRTSGGSGGKVYVECVLSGASSYAIDYATATTIVNNPNDTNGNSILEGIDAYSTVSGWYTSTQYESTDGWGYDISKYGFSVTLTREEADLREATAGHSVTTDKYGTWICGTAIRY